MSDAATGGGELAGRVAVITGAARGLGLAIARGMAAAGASVAMGARSTAAGERAAAEVRALGGRTQCFECDVTSEASVEAFGDGVLAAFGRVDIVVANSGVIGPTEPLQAISLESWRACMSVNVDGVYLTFRRFIPGLLEQRSGALIAIGSVTGKRPLVNRSPYAASKMAVIGLVRALATELGPSGITVNAVCPGAVTGPRAEEVIAAQVASLGITADEARRGFVDGAALRRMVDPTEIAAACVFLASDRGAAITGEDLNVNAGLAMF